MIASRAVPTAASTSGRSISLVPWPRPSNKVDATVPALITAPTAGSKDMSASARSLVTWLLAATEDADGGSVSRRRR
jgi:hypothetical protein